LTNITCLPTLGILPCFYQLIIIMHISLYKYQFENVKLTLFYLALITVHDLTYNEKKLLKFLF